MQIQRASSSPATTQSRVASNVTVNGWCSWCFNKCPHAQVQGGGLGLPFFTRTSFSCRVCDRRTLPCRSGCGAFSRGFSHWDEEYCAVCQKRASQWMPGGRICRAFKMGRCSWCFQETRMFLHVHHSFRTSLYECGNCGRITRPCGSCRTAYAKCSQDSSESKCALCMHILNSWPGAAGTGSQGTPRHLWCSRCLSMELHTPEVTALRVAPVFTCSGCGALGLRCKSCRSATVTSSIATDILLLQLPPDDGTSKDSENPCCLMCAYVQRVQGVRPGADAIVQTRNGRAKSTEEAVYHRKQGHGSVKASAPSYYDPGSSSAVIAWRPGMGQHFDRTPESVPSSVDGAESSSMVAKEGEVWKGGEVWIEMSWAELARMIRCQRDKGSNAGESQNQSKVMNVQENPLTPSSSRSSSTGKKSQAKVQSKSSADSAKQEQPLEVSNFMDQLVRPPCNEPVKEAGRRRWLQKAQALSDTRIKDWRKWAKNGDGSDRMLYPSQPAMHAATDILGGEFQQLTFCNCVPPALQALFMPLLQNAHADQGLFGFVETLVAGFSSGASLLSSPPVFYFDLVFAPNGDPLALFCYWAQKGFDMARYAGLPFLASLSWIGFNPLDLDLVFLAIPFLEQPGFVFSPDILSEDQIERIFQHEISQIMSRHSPSALAALSKHGSAGASAWTKAGAGRVPYLPDTVMSVENFSSFPHYFETRGWQVKRAVRQRLKAFGQRKGRIEMWKWEDMSVEDREKCVELCQLVQDMHGLAGSPDLFEVSPSLHAAMATCKTLPQMKGFNFDRPIVAAPKKDKARAKGGKKKGGAVNSKGQPPEPKKSKARGPRKSKQKQSVSPKETAMNATKKCSETAKTSSCNDIVESIVRDLIEKLVLEGSGQNGQSIQVASSEEIQAKAHGPKGGLLGMLTSEGYSNVHGEGGARIPAYCGDTDPGIMDAPVLFSMHGSLSWKDPCKWLLAKSDGKVIGCMLLVYSGTTAFGLFQGLDYDKSRACKAYFNLLYAMVEDAILHKGVTHIRAGCTTYFTKHKLGCSLEAVDLHFLAPKIPTALHGTIISVLEDAIIEAANFDG